VELKAGQGMFGKADPYARLRIGLQDFMTKPNPGGGKNPIWNEEFVFDISNERELEVEVLDKETVGNDKFMGKCKVSIMEWIANGKFEGDLDLEDKAGKNVGRISISCSFARPNVAGAMAEEEEVTKEQLQLAIKPDGGGPRDPGGKFTDDEILEAFKVSDRAYPADRVLAPADRSTHVHSRGKHLAFVFAGFRPRQEQLRGRGGDPARAHQHRRAGDVPSSEVSSLGGHAADFFFFLYLFSLPRR